MARRRKVHANEDELSLIGINNPAHQKIVIEALPCGIVSVAEALRDSTPWQINAPRALCICAWKGLVHGLVKAEAAHACRTVPDA